jgi:hypothetical protein
MPVPGRLQAHHLTTTAAVSLVAYLIHNGAWIAHELSGAAAWPRALERVYLVSLVLWVPGLLATLWMKRASRRQSPGIVLRDERSDAQFARAHMIALVIVLLVQLPFFVVDIPSRVLAQVTVTTCVIALFGTYAWLERG